MKKKDIHFGYILLFALVVIIYLLTVKFGSHDELVKYLGFGLTITSLFVGLFAIAQGFFAGSSLDKTIGVLDKSTQNMLTTAVDVKNIIQTLQTRIDEIPKQITDLSDKVTSKLLSSEIDKNDDSIKNQKVKLTKEQSIEFLKSSSANGLLAMYAATQSNDNKKQFNLDNLFADTHVKPSYAFGYIVAARSFKIFNLERKDLDIQIDKSLINSHDVKPILLERIEKSDSDSAQLKDIFMQVVDKIENHFS